MKQKLNKTERKFISPAINYNWKIEPVGSSGLYAWDGDTQMGLYVKVGVVCKALINKGFLEYVYQSVIRKTNLADSFKCSCDNGNKHIFDDNFDCVVETIKCNLCDGIGVLSEPITKGKHYATK